jgi:hypothetical protein
MEGKVASWSQTPPKGAKKKENNKHVAKKWLQ